MHAKSPDRIMRNLNCKEARKKKARQKMGSLVEESKGSHRNTTEVKLNGCLHNHG